MGFNAFSLWAKIGLDTSEYDKGLDSAGGKIHSFGENLKSGLATAAKVGAAGLAVATTAVTALSKVALDSYGDYEQLTGGVETLFKTSADVVMEYANNAYQTAGLSANQYMETVTSFSASLLQGLGGDTEEAARIADLAITDMADNANKMGTAMDSIQNAYQGFAKQNYTMLDNLKLGYGGTQAEMARLINDSGVLGDTMKVTAETVNQVSFDKMIEAIHVVQTEIGITGTTAAEAATTIQGSVASAKSAWENLVTGIGNENADLFGLITQFVDSVGTAAENIIPRITQILSGMGSAIQTIAPVIAEQVPALIEGVLPSLLEAGVSLVDGLLSGIISALPALAEAAPKIILQLSDAIMDNLPGLLTAAVFVITVLAAGIADSLPELIPAAVETIVQFVEALTNPDNIGSLVDAAIEIIIALAQGLIQAVPQLLEAVPTIIKNLNQAVIENAPKLAGAAIELLLSLGIGMVEAIPELLAYVVEIPAAIIGGIKDGLSGLAEIGPDIIRGLWEGISGMYDWLFDQLSGFFGRIVDGVKGLLGIHSPSTLFSGIGENMALGLGKGWDSKFSYIKSQIEGGMNFGTANVDFTSSGMFKSGQMVSNSIISAPSNSGGEIVIDFTATLDGEILARKMYRYNQKENTRRGVDLAMG